MLLRETIATSCLPLSETSARMKPKLNKRDPIYSRLSWSIVGKLDREHETQMLIGINDHKDKGQAIIRFSLSCKLRNCKE